MKSEGQETRDTTAPRLTLPEIFLTRASVEHGVASAGRASNHVQEDAPPGSRACGRGPASRRGQRATAPRLHDDLTAGHRLTTVARQAPGGKTCDDCCTGGNRGDVTATQLGVASAQRLRFGGNDGMTSTAWDGRHATRRGQRATARDKPGERATAARVRSEQPVGHPYRPVADCRPLAPTRGTFGRYRRVTACDRRQCTLSSRRSNRLE